MRLSCELLRLKFARRRHVDAKTLMRKLKSLELRMDYARAFARALHESWIVCLLSGATPRGTGYFSTPLQTGHDLDLSFFSLILLVS